MFGVLRLLIPAAPAQLVLSWPVESLSAREVVVRATGFGGLEERYFLPQATGGLEGQIEPSDDALPVAPVKVRLRDHVDLPEGKRLMFRVTPKDGTLDDLIEGD